MARHGKKYREAVSKIDQTKLYSPKEALDLIKEVSYTKFDSTVDLAVNLGVDPKQADQNIRGAVPLPHGLGKTVRVLVFAKGDKALEAKDAGAEYVGGDELAKQITDGWMEFDQVIATPDMMGVVGRLGKILGPRGMMPNPKVGTVTMDVTKAINEVKAGRVEYRVDKAGVIHAPFGKVSFDSDKLLDNFNTLIDTLLKAKPSTSKGTYMKKVYISSTMGPSVKINVASFKA